jgi:hypothetical protein
LGTRWSASRNWRGHGRHLPLSFSLANGILHRPGKKLIQSLSADANPSPKTFEQGTLSCIDFSVRGSKATGFQKDPVHIGLTLAGISPFLKLALCQGRKILGLLGVKFEGAGKLP